MNVNIFCPNLSNVETRREFDRIANVVGHRQAYVFWNLNNGNTADLNADGTVAERLAGESDEEFIRRRYIELQLANDIANDIKFFKREIRKHVKGKSKVKEEATEEPTPEELETNNSKIHFVNLIRTAMLNSGKPVHYTTTNNIKSLVNLATEQNDTIKILAHDKKLLGVIYNNEAYLNKDEVSAYSQMYMYTQLWAHMLYNSTNDNDAGLWDAICEFITTDYNQLKPDSLKNITEPEKQRLEKAKQTALNTLRLENVPAITDTNNFNLFCAEVISVLSAEDTPQLYNDINSKRNIQSLFDNTSADFKMSVYKKAINSIAKALQSFWNKILSFFTNEDYYVGSIYELTHMSFNDLMTNAKDALYHANRRKDIIENKFTADEIRTFDAQTDALRTENIDFLSVNGTHNEVRGSIYRQNYKKQKQLADLQQKFYTDDSVSFYEKSSLVLSYRNATVDVMQQLMDEDSEIFQLLETDEKQKISNVLKQNKFDPFVDIIKIININKYQQLVTQQVKNYIADYGDETVNSSLMQFIDTYKNICMLEIYDFLTATFGLKIRLNFKTDSAEVVDQVDETKNSQDENILSDDLDVREYLDSVSEDIDPENETDDTVNEFLQVSQMHRSLYRNVEAAVKFYLSAIPTNKRDAFGNYITYSSNDILRQLISNFNQCKTLNELQQAIQNSALPYSRQLLRLLNENSVFANKLLSNIQMTINELDKYKVSGDNDVVAERLNTVVKTTDDKYKQAIFSQIGTDVNNPTLFLKTKDGYKFNNTYAELLRNNIKALKTKYHESVDKLDFDQVAGYKHTINSATDYDKLLKSTVRELQNLFKQVGLDISLGALQKYCTQAYTVQSNNVARNKTYARSTFWVDKIFSSFETSLTKIQQRLDKNDISTEGDLVNNIQLIFIPQYGKVKTFEPIEFKASVNGGYKKTYSVISPSNFIQRLVGDLAAVHNDNNAIAAIKTRMEQSLFHNTLYESPNEIDLLHLIEGTGDMTPKLNTTTTMDTKPYSEFNRVKYLVYSLLNYKNKRFILPVFADKSTHYSLNGLSQYSGSFNENGYQNDIILNDMYVVFQQEVDRMRNLYATRNESVSKIKNFNRQKITDGIIPFGEGFRFNFFPYFNDILRNINNIKLLSNGVDRQIAQDLANYILGKSNNIGTTNYIKDKINEYMLQQTEAFITEQQNALQFVKDFGNKTGLNTDTLQDTITNVCANYLNDQQLVYDWFWNITLANMEMCELLSGDLAFYKDPTDVSKRFAQNISPGTRQNAVDSIYQQGRISDGKGGWNEKYHDSKKHYIVLKDETRNVLTNDIDSIFKLALSQLKSRLQQATKHDGTKYTTSEINSRLEKERKKLDRFREHYKTSCDATDGQGLVSIDYVGRLLSSLGRDNKFKQLYPKLVATLDHYDPTLTGEKAVTNKNECIAMAKDALKNNTRIVVEVIKQFTYAQRMERATFDENSKQWIVPTQIKNAEFPLLDLITLFNDPDDTRLRLAKLMREEGIDAIYFNSNVKVGDKASANSQRLSDYNTTNELIDEIRNNIRGKNEETHVSAVDISDVVLQQESVSHYKDFQIVLGNQIMKLINNAFANKSDNNTIYIDDNKLKMGCQTFKKKFYEILAQKIELNKMSEIYDSMGVNIDKTIEEIAAHFQSQDKTKRKFTEQEVRLRIDMAISNYLQRQIQNDNKYDTNLLEAVSLDDFGELNVYANDPIIFDKLASVVVNIIKKVTTRLEVPGGQLIQVSDAVSIFGRDKQNEIEGDKNLKVVYTTDKNGRRRISHFEARIAPYNSLLYKHYMGEDGKIDIKRIEQENPQLLEMVAYRIPTEGYCSMIPIKIVDFTNEINGGIIQLPDEVTARMGVDFDIDKLFVPAPDIIEKDGKIIVPQPDFENPEKNNTHQVNNGILQMIRAALRSPYVTVDMTIPSNYFELKDYSYKMAILDYKAEEAKRNNEPFNTQVVYDTLSKMDSNELEAEFKQTLKDIDICIPTTQMLIHDRNYAGKEILAIAASTSTVHSLARDWNLTVKVNPFILSGIHLNDEVKFDPMYMFDGYTTVHSAIKEVLTASPDTAKDPVFENMNLTRSTVNFAITLLRLGYDLETMTLFLKQPVVRLYNTIANFDNSDYNAATMKMLEDFFNKVESKHQINFRFDSDKDFSKELLVNNLAKPLDISVLEVETLTDQDREFLANQYQIFTLMKNFAEISSNSQIIRQVANQNNQSSKENNTLFEMITAQQKLDSRIDKIRTNDQKVNEISKNVLNVLVPGTSEYNPFLHKAYTVKKNLLTSFTKFLFPQLDYFVGNITPNTTNAAKYKQTYNDWMTFAFFNLPVLQDGEERVGYLSHDKKVVDFYKKVFPAIAAQRITELLNREEYQQNTFLRSIKFNSRTSNGETFPYLLLNTSDIAKEDSGRIAFDWAMLLCGDEDVKRFAKELFIYSLYKDGFAYTYDTLTKVTPVLLIKEFPQYNEFLKRFASMTQKELDEMKKKFQAYQNKHNDVVGGDIFHTLYSENITDEVNDAVEIESPESNRPTTIQVDLNEKVKVFNVDIMDEMIRQAESTMELTC